MNEKENGKVMSEIVKDGDLVFRARIEELQYKANSLQAQLEGIFRQCYQACGQFVFAARLQGYVSMVEDATELCEKLARVVDEFEKLKASVSNSPATAAASDKVTPFRPMQ